MTDSPAKQDLDSPVLTINVGGVLYQTTKATLTQGSEFFRGLFRLNSTTRDAEGRIFIDRNGAAFGPVLDFLRHRELFIPQDLTHQQIQCEAEFFLVDGLMRELSEREDEEARVAALSEKEPTLRDSICEGMWIESPLLAMAFKPGGRVLVTEVGGHLTGRPLGNALSPEAVLRLYLLAFDGVEDDGIGGNDTTKHPQSEAELAALKDDAFYAGIANQVTKGHYWLAGQRVMLQLSNGTARTRALFSFDRNTLWYQSADGFLKGKLERAGV